MERTQHFHWHIVTVCVIHFNYKWFYVVAAGMVHVIHFNY